MNFKYKFHKKNQPGQVHLINNENPYKYKKSNQSNEMDSREKYKS